MSFKNLMSDLLSLFVLKANFNSLFDSRLNSKKEFIATQAAIGPTVSTVQITASGQTVVSPCSGYAYLRFGGLTSASKSFLNVETEHVTHQHDLSYTGYVNSMQVPVQKGENITVNYKGFSNPTSHSLRFHKFVGGGLNRIIQAIRGGLCHLSHSLNRYSSSLVAKRLQKAIRFNWMEHWGNTLLPVMVISYLVQLRLVETSLISMLGERCPSRVLGLRNAQHVLKSLVQKVKRCIGTTVEHLTFTPLPHQKARLSLAIEGGAL